MVINNTPSTDSSSRSANAVSGVKRTERDEEMDMYGMTSRHNGRDELAWLAGVPPRYREQFIQAQMAKLEETKRHFCGK